MYNPTLGVWLTRDPAGAGPDPYEYVDDNPTTLVDPMGLAPVATQPATQPSPLKTNLKDNDPSATPWAVEKKAFGAVTAITKADIAAKVETDGKGKFWLSYTISVDFKIRFSDAMTETARNKDMGHEQTHVQSYIAEFDKLITGENAAACKKTYTSQVDAQTAADAEKKRIRQRMVWVAVREAAHANPGSPDERAFPQMINNKAGPEVTASGKSEWEEYVFYDDVRLTLQQKNKDGKTLAQLVATARTNGATKQKLQQIIDSFDSSATTQP